MFIKNVIFHQQSKIAEIIYIREMHGHHIKRKDDDNLSAFQEITSELNRFDIPISLYFSPYEKCQKNNFFTRFSNLQSHFFVMGKKLLAHCLTSKIKKNYFANNFFILFALFIISFFILFFRWKFLKNTLSENVIHPLAKKIEIEAYDKISSELTTILLHDLMAPLSICREVIKRNDSPLDKEEIFILQESLGRMEEICLVHLKEWKEKFSSQNIKISLGEVKKSLLFLPQTYPHITFHFIDKLEKKDIFLQANKTYLHRIFTNLVKNSTEAFNEGKNNHITFYFKDYSSYIEIIVSDNGPGFKDFSFISHKEEGHGIGLSSAKEKLKEWGGDLFLKNNRKGGAKITLKILKVH